MTVRIEDKSAERVVGVRVVGPYPQTIPQGCQRLMAWQQQHQVPLGKWLVLYWDDLRGAYLSGYKATRAGALGLVVKTAEWMINGEKKEDLAG
ncbi:DNA gyrase inhibitor [Serratia quinivorans]|nr:DNA gyrase inhibitor [Serratia quinivorans]